MQINATSEELEKAAQTIMEGFAWDKSPQGEGYWHNVYMTLRALAENVSIAAAAAKAREEDDAKAKAELKAWREAVKKAKADAEQKAQADAQLAKEAARVKAEAIAAIKEEMLGWNPGISTVHPWAPGQGIAAKGPRLKKHEYDQTSEISYDFSKTYNFVCKTCDNKELIRDVRNRYNLGNERDLAIRVAKLEHQFGMDA